MDMPSSIQAWLQTIKKKYTVYSRRTEDRVQFNGSLSGGEKPVTDNANYFENSSDLIYDTRLELRPNVNHIIDDNIARFPTALQTMDKYQLGILLEGTIKDAIRRIRRNYKTAVPQYYDGRLQLLLPLCLTSKASADLALVIEKEHGVYRASTCLTLDMAINNARLIAKPDDEWLKV